MRGYLFLLPKRSNNHKIPPPHYLLFVGFAATAWLQHLFRRPCIAASKEHAGKHGAYIHAFAGIKRGRWREGEKEALRFLREWTWFRLRHASLANHPYIAATKPDVASTECRGKRTKNKRRGPAPEALKCFRQWGRRLRIAPKEEPGETPASSKLST